MGLTVWFGVGVAGTLLSFAFQFLVPAMPISLVGGVLTVVLLGVAVRLMYRPASTAYFTPVQAAAMPSGLWQQPPAPQQAYGQRFEVAVPSSYAPWHTRALSGLIDHGVPTTIFFVFYVPFGNGTHGMGGNQGLLVMLAVIDSLPDCLAQRLTERVIHGVMQCGAADLGGHPLRELVGHISGRERGSRGPAEKHALADGKRDAKVREPVPVLVEIGKVDEFADHPRSCGFESFS